MQHHDTAYDWIYGTYKWKKLRSAYKKQVGGLCERCLKAGVLKAGEFVHHKVHLDANNMHDETVTLNMDNLELLCRECHAAEHSKSRYIVDATGYVHAR